jgi:hypothetical protein
MRSMRIASGQLNFCAVSLNVQSRRCPSPTLSPLVRLWFAGG